MKCSFKKSLYFGIFNYIYKFYFKYKKFTTLIFSRGFIGTMPLKDMENFLKLN